MVNKILEDLREKFLVFNHLLQKTFLEERLSCLDQSEKDSLKYFTCLQNLSNKNNGVLALLSTKIGSCDVYFNDCIEKCGVSFKDSENELVNCESKCRRDLKFCTDHEYSLFYKK